MSATAPAATGHDPRYARYALGVIFAANLVSYLDRQLVSALETPIKDSLHLNSAQFGFLWTLFTLGYMFCSPFIGYASDRHRRPRIFAICVLIWSVATIASGMAPSKAVLYVSRVLIGLGEAGCLVIGSALISDFFSAATRGRALSIFYLGLPFGGTIAFIMAGALLPLGVSWRTLFYIAGVPGFVLTALIWKLIDPPRGGHHVITASEADPGPATGVAEPHRPDPEASQPPGARSGHSTAGSGLKHYLELFRTPSLIFIILAQAFAVIILVPLVHFGVDFFVKVRHMDPDRARLTLGAIAAIGGALGSSASGYLGDRLAKRTRSAYALLSGASYLLGFPCLLVGFLVPHRWIFLPALTLGAFFIFLCMPTVNTLIANVTHPSRRAMAWALAVFILHLLGDTLSPPIFGAVDDRIGRLKSFSIFSIALVPASICCFLAARTAARDEARANAAPRPAS